MKKLIVEIDDKYADAVSMSFIGTKYVLWENGGEQA